MRTSILSLNKLLLTGLIICLSSNSFGQLKELRGRWITPTNEFFEIRDTTNRYSNSNYVSTKEWDEGASVSLKGKILQFKACFALAPNKLKIGNQTYDLKILSHNDSTLIVKPVSALSRYFLKTKKHIKYTRQEYTTDTSIKLEKIVFNTTFCDGSCPEYHLEINRSLETRLVVNIDNWFDSDTTKRGNFKGFLEREKFDNLESLVRSCNLRTLQFVEGGFDGSIITIIIYFNGGQKKYLKSMFPPQIARLLINYLYSICYFNTFDS